MNTKEFNPDVYFAADSYPSFSENEVMELREKALSKDNGKIRICMHTSPEDSLHEMLIALRKDVRYPIHKCPARSETHIVLHGVLTVNLFNPDGTLLERVPLGVCQSGRKNYLRVPANMFHSLSIESDVCVFLEIKLGPFDPTDNVVAGFTFAEENA